MSTGPWILIALSMATALLLAVTYADPQFGGGLGNLNPSGALGGQGQRDRPGHQGHGHNRPRPGGNRRDEDDDNEDGNDSEEDRPRGGRPRPAPASPFGPANPIALAAEGLEYGPKIRDLVEVVGLTLTEMGNLAVADDADIGARIVNILQAEIVRANKVLADWTAKTAGGGVAGGARGGSGGHSHAGGGRGRGKRAVDDSGKTAYNEVGDILVDSNEKIATDKGKLSPQAQEKIDASHAKGIEKCDADPCKTYKGIKNKTKGAQRQG